MSSSPTLQALTLYRNIMRLHRDKLPPIMRQLGDVYIRKEFRTHMYSAKCSLPQFDQFLKSWALYHQTLLSQQKVIGDNLSDEATKKLNDDQLSKLADLKKEIDNL